MKKKISHAEGFMDFEHMLRQFFGDKAYGNQSIRENVKLLKKELRKVVSKIEHRIIGLETTTRHKEMMLSEVEKIKGDFLRNEVDPWTLVIHLLSLTSRLLGYDYQKGFINTPLYHQTFNQYYSQIILEGGDVIQSHYDKKNLIKIQRELYFKLKEEKYSDFKIAQIMNTTEHQIKKLKKNL